MPADLRYQNGFFSYDPVACCFSLSIFLCFFSAIAIIDAVRMDVSLQALSGYHAGRRVVAESFAEQLRSRWTPVSKRGKKTAG
jgi:hypothetical protein